MKIFLFLSLFFSHIGLLAKPANSPSEALFIARAMRENDSQEAFQIEKKAQAILSRKVEGCKKEDLAEICFNSFIRTQEIKSSKEALAAMRLAYDAARRDLEDRRVSKAEARVLTNANLIAILERVNLKKNWLFSYELKSQQDEFFVKNLKKDVVLAMREARAIMIESVETSSKGMAKFKAKSKIVRQLALQSSEHLRKIKTLKNAPLSLE